MAINENIEKEKTVETFMNQVLIDNDNIDNESDCDICYEAELYRTCHEWQGQKHPDGYGAFTVYSKQFGKKFTVKAHRFAYANEFGINSLPDGLAGGERNVINHLCHNRACVNPYHLEVISNDENVSSAKRKPKNG